MSGMEMIFILGLAVLALGGDTPKRKGGGVYTTNITTKRPAIPASVKRNKK